MLLINKITFINPSVLVGLLNKFYISIHILIFEPYWWLILKCFAPSPKQCKRAARGMRITSLFITVLYS